MNSAPEGTSPRALPAWLWLWTPITLPLLQVAAKAINEERYRVLVRGEFGLVENLTVLFLVVALVTALRLFRERKAAASPLFGPLMLTMAIGCVFFAGEEASWGQHWLGFEPPAGIADRNEQGEFNFHNDPVLGDVLDQLPRILLSLAALIGGVIVPLLRRGQEPAPDFRSRGPWGWLWPTVVCVPTCVVALTVTVPKKLFHALQMEIPYLLEIRPGETKEFCLALFIMLYLLTLHRALKARRQLSPQAKSGPADGLEAVPGGHAATLPNPKNQA